MKKKPSIVVLGGTGLIGAAVGAHFTRLGHEVVAVDSKNYAAHVGTVADVLINCNGNSYRFKANRDPAWDFQASVLSVQRSLFDFTVGRYVHVSTIDVYPDCSDPELTGDEMPIDSRKLNPYGFHKWMAERLVERFGSQPLILRVGTVIGPGLKKGPVFDLLQNEPLHMALDSELSLIDTDTIAGAIATFIEKPPNYSIINLTGSGPAELGELCRQAGLQPKLAPGAEAVRHRYHLNNARLRELTPVASSLEMAVRFLTDSLRAKL